MDSGKLKHLAKAGLSRALFLGARPFAGLISRNLLNQASYDRLLAEAAERLAIIDREPQIAYLEEVIFDPRFNALYRADGSIIESTALTRHDADRRIKAPERIEVDSAKLQRIDAAIYAGTLFDNHFGHFLAESLSRLWPVTSAALPEDAHDAALLFRRASAGFPIGRIDEVVDTVMREISGPVGPLTTPQAQVAIGRAWVPERTFMIGRFAHRAFRESCTRIGQRILERHGLIGENRFSDRQVYLSRSGLSATQRRIIGEEKFETALRARNFDIVRPENLSFAEQIALLNSARLVVGAIGSAFHTQLLAPSDKMRMIYLTARNTSPTYLLIDRLCDIEAHYVHALADARIAGRYFYHQILDCDRAIEAVDRITI